MHGFVALRRVILCLVVPVVVWAAEVPETEGQRLGYALGVQFALNVFQVVRPGEFQGEALVRGVQHVLDGAEPEISAEDMGAGAA